MTKFHFSAVLPLHSPSHVDITNLLSIDIADELRLLHLRSYGDAYVESNSHCVMSKGAEQSRGSSVCMFLVPKLCNITNFVGQTIRSGRCVRKR
jgi:hypothetical protein